MFSVITISRDRPHSFRNHLACLQAQNIGSAKPWELIIIDDSTEGDGGQEAVIRDLSGGFRENTRAYRARGRTEYGGEAKSINFAIKQTRGDPIFVLCGDDLFPSEHFSMMHTIWDRLHEAGKTRVCLGWPLYHLKEGAEVDFDTLDVCPEVGQAFLSRREETGGDDEPGLNLFFDLLDDRAVYSREFLFNIKGWPEWRGRWWRDAWMREILSVHGFEVIVDWASWSLHQWHARPVGQSAYDAESKAHYEKYAGKVDVSNEGDWGEADMTEIELIGG
jgi:hypothetical protein